MSAQDGPGRTGRVVDFDGLDDEAGAGSDRSRVVSFDDLDGGSGTGPGRSQVVSFDDLDTETDTDLDTDGEARTDAARDRVMSFDGPDPDMASGAADAVARVVSFDGALPSGSTGPADVVSFDGPGRGGGRSATRRPRRPARDRDDGTEPVAADPATAVGTDTDTDTNTDADETATARGGRRGRGGGTRRTGRGRDGADGHRSRSAPTGADPQDDESRAREICLRLLTDRARTVKELSDALRRKEIPDDVANRVLERFDEVGLVDDEAFAGQWVRSRHRHKGLGRRAIAMELHRKGVDREIADEALSEIDPESEEARARELVDRRIRTMRVATKEDRASTARRLVGMLARKGYGSGVAYGVVREAITAKGAEEDELGESPADD